MISSIAFCVCSCSISPSVAWCVCSLLADALRHRPDPARGERREDQHDHPRRDDLDEDARPPRHAAGDDPRRRLDQRRTALSGPRLPRRAPGDRERHGDHRGFRRSGGKLPRPAAAADRTTSDGEAVRTRAGRVRCIHSLYASCAFSVSTSMSP